MSWEDTFNLISQDEVKEINSVEKTEVEKLIEVFKTVSSRYCDGCDCDDKCTENYGPCEKPYKFAMVSMMKQIPTKPIMQSYAPALCPCCHCELSESVGDGYYKHKKSKKVCDCGQKLDWSFGEDADE